MLMWYERAEAEIENDLTDGLITEKEYQAQVRELRQEMQEPGFCEGETCLRDGCNGVIDVYPVENCSCHLNAPCSACTSPRNFCPECDWEEADD